MTIGVRRMIIVSIGKDDYFVVPGQRPENSGCSLWKNIPDETWFFRVRLKVDDRIAAFTVGSQKKMFKFHKLKRRFIIESSITKAVFREETNPAKFNIFDVGNVEYRQTAGQQ